ncbi:MULTISPECIES: competence/damage-inducible protein A [Aerococcus]|uniref:Putative competence-damage inducible protein n=1 Tax=Aerococcus tenax TaxID=3078812 RepID=A0A5N1BRR6_9LACT|nr:competence/damage-inducible protein A [Aerococcus urinae]KAA9242795.1 competence/damage-inducible protein A [Aerococcus urinae]MDK6370987.1 competence/damage-inducible protein A [Aerococcus urinae]MDK6598002.1 competence/damage-inducible protein A [Aerococcus urinae]MDK7301806.1 competence/damage-inducible protein A [Aerococcus urinae]MDK7801242.1 competence/damage-inducible protein A [Aerococcus urinae]
MKAEIIAVGTEMLMGQIVNTNAPFIARQLNELGIEHYYETVVGDNPERLVELSQIAESRSDMIIYSGGIGPTQDDLTKQVIAEYLNEELIYDQECLEQIKQYYQDRHQSMSSNNLQMALTFKNGQSLKNETGQACGSLIHKNGCLYVFLPGFPDELEPMFINEVKPYLFEHLSNKQVLASRFLNFFGIGEAALTSRLEDLIAKQSNPTIAPYASKSVVTLRLTAQGENHAVTDKLLDQTQEEILALVGDYYYGSGYNYLPMDALFDYLNQEGKTIAFAESLTGGLAAHLLVNHEGSSKIFKGSTVSYSEYAKAHVIGVSQATLDQEGMVSEACARQMAELTCSNYGADYAISFTGVAGPDKMEGQEVGTVYCGFASRGQSTQVKRYQINGNRSAIRLKVIYQAVLDFIQEKA